MELMLINVYEFNCNIDDYSILYLFTLFEFKIFIIKKLILHSEVKQAIECLNINQIVE